MENTVSAPKDNTKPSEKQPLLCEVCPFISACQPLGMAPSPQGVSNRDVGINVSPSSGFGPSDAACPSPRSASTAFGTFDLSFEPVCDFAIALRPILIALAWLSVGFAAFGIGGRD